jgi:hypothetical protein
MRVKRQAKQRWVVVRYINEMVHSGEKTSKTKVRSGKIHESKMVHSGEKGGQNKGACVVV